MARSPLFHHLTLFMIVLYAVWIAIDADNNKASVLLDADLEFQIPEHIFCTYFFMEWIIRSLANQGGWGRLPAMRAVRILLLRVEQLTLQFMGLTAVVRLT